MSESNLNGYPDFTNAKHLIGKHLTLEMYKEMQDKQTNSGATLDLLMQTGVDNPHHSVGVACGDEECYEKFADILDKVIEGRHRYPKDAKHKRHLDPTKIVGGELDPKYVLSCRVRTGRGIRGYALPPHCTRAERRDVQAILRSALEKLDGPLKGEYLPLEEMTPERVDELIDQHFLFEHPTSSFMLTSGMARDWPDARGIFLNKDQNFLVWVNEEDHSRVISMQKGGNMKEVFNRFCTGLTTVEEIIKKDSGTEFMYNDHLGFVLTCPSNLGTGLRGGVHAKIPLISEHPKFNEILDKCRLQKRGTGGEEDHRNTGTYDISNWDRLGKSEVEQVQLVIDGVDLLVQMEKRLEKGESIDDLLPGEHGAVKRDPIAATGSEVKQLHDNKWRATPKSDNFPHVAKHSNIMAKTLTKATYDEVMTKKTKLNGSIDKCIQTGVDNKGEATHPGIVAVDEECYSAYSKVFDPIIKEIHGCGMSTKQPGSDMDSSKLKNAELDAAYVECCSVGAARSLKGYRFPPTESRFDRRAVELQVSKALGSMDGKLKGAYTPYGKYSEDERKSLVAEGKLFSKPVDPVLVSNDIARDWPDARGSFQNADKNFFVWVNEQEHSVVMSCQKGGNVKEVFDRFSEGLKKYEAGVKSAGKEFATDANLGYLNSCPSNIGTGLKASIAAKIPKVCAHAKCAEIMKGLKLSIGSCKDGVCTVKNRQSFGSTEVAQVQAVIDGVSQLIKIEKELAAGKSADDLIKAAAGK